MPSKKAVPKARRVSTGGSRRPLRARSAAPTAGPGAPGRARTVVFVHGIGNKPEQNILKCQWDHALFGFDLGERSRLAYWVDRDQHGPPEAASCGSGDLVTAGFEALESRGRTGPAALRALRAELEDEAWLAQYGGDPKVKRRMVALAAEIERQSAQVTENEINARAVEAKVLWLPAPLRKWITRRLTRLLLHDVHAFFYDDERREVMRESLRERLRPGGGPFVVIGHSQGSMIAWDVLSEFDPGEIDVELFVTIGSPLGLKEVQDQLKSLRQTKKLAVPKVVRRWRNFSDRFDPVCLDNRLGNDYAANAAGVAVEDARVTNPDSPRHPHSGSGYLSHALVRGAVREAVEAQLFQPVASFTLARDLVRALENSPSRSTHEVLIELAAPDEGSLTPERKREEVLGAIAAFEQLSRRPIRVESLRHFVAAELTREETEALAERLGRKGSASFAVSKVWRNAKKRALLDKSRQTVQATAAGIGYLAEGEGVHWAVLDTGIRADHPHFARHANIVEQVDCTGASPGDPTDRFGHGTHVAGIIAGEYRAAGGGEALAGIAPKAKLHIYKTLDDSGSGRDSWIIKALDRIAEQNEAAGKAVIHGVNLSLGGSFDQSVYACGYSPLCRELRRLWRQGVLVVIAAGNEGFAVLQTTDGTVEANMDLSIGDPANLEDAIVVGSVHKENPYTYGISYFSSRGPTADGRCKPDLVAPGEKILSCRHRWASAAASLSDLYVEMSGTSMATPHVSGLLAAFLSVRREFLGEPDRVKRILLANCSDLGRDRPMQGAGLPNLVKMLVNT